MRSALINMTTLNKPTRTIRKGLVYEIAAYTILLALMMGMAMERREGAAPDKLAGVKSVFQSTASAK